MATLTTNTKSKTNFNPSKDVKLGDFDEELFETRLESLKDTQDGIQAMSTWCLANRTNHKKIVSCWLNVFKRVRVEHRLVLFYLANDVIQYSKRKHYEFVEAWATALQRATTMVRDAKVKNKILRIFKIWEQREIYNEEFLTDLSGLLNISPPKPLEPSTENSEYQCARLIKNIKECVQLSEATDKSFKKLPKPPNFDLEHMKLHVKDKAHSNDVQEELERYKTYIQAFIKNLNSEIKSRKEVIENLNIATKYYSQQRNEVKVVVTAYKSFGSRLKIAKKKLDEMIETLPSPVPSPDINAPSPEREADLKLPDEDASPISTNFLNDNINGYSSFLDGKLPFDINDFKDETNTTSQPIEVISSRSDEESYNNTSVLSGGNGTLSLTGYGNTHDINIPGLSNMSLPTVPQSEYTSLARAQQYIAEPGVDYLASYRNEASSSSWDMQDLSSWPNNTNLSSPDAEYSELNSSVGSLNQDVDQRQILLPHAFLGTTSNKLGLSKEKSRQLDIDHRNLISLTGSPGNDIDKKSLWTPGTEKEDYNPNESVDIDYRNVTEHENTSNNNIMPEPLKKDDVSMVVDMDMSDEDLDDMFRDVNETVNKNEFPIADNGSFGLPPPPPPPLPSIGVDGPVQSWPASPWSNGNNNTSGLPAVPPPPCPPPPFPMQNTFQYGAPTDYNNGSMGVRGGRGRGNWQGNSPNPFRTYGPRGPGPRPNNYYARGGGNGGSMMMRGIGKPFRGKFRGNHAWT